MSTPQVPPAPHPPLPVSSKKRPRNAVDDPNWTDTEHRKPVRPPTNWGDVCSRNKPADVLKHAMDLENLLDISHKRALEMYSEITVISSSLVEAWHSKVLTRAPFSHPCHTLLSAWDASCVSAILEH
jgi:hypothetical protein